MNIIYYVSLFIFTALQVMHLCWAHGLYDAIINIFNRGMKDYSGPLCELLVHLLSALDTGLPLSGDDLI